MNNLIELLQFITILVRVTIGVCVILYFVELVKQQKG